MLFKKIPFYQGIEGETWIINNNIADQLAINDTLFHVYNVLMVFGV
jgi:hypothetical protein